jgi:hypothetical protein
MPRTKQPVLDPIAYAEQVLTKAHRRVKRATALTWACLPVALILGVVEYVRLFGGLNALDLVLLPLLVLAGFGTLMGGLTSGIFSRAALPSNPEAEDEDPQTLRERVWELLLAQITLVVLAVILATTWILQLQHPSTHAPGYPFIPLLPVAAFLCLSMAGAVNVFRRMHRATLREMERY